MISEEKMVHIVHLMLDGIKKAGLVELPKEEEAIREARRTCLLFLNHLNSVADLARQRILSQKNPPQEHTSQWDNLYQKYLEEEWRKKGG